MPPAIDPSLVAVVEALPRKHRQHLEAVYANAFAAGARSRTRTEAIARRIGPRNIQHYDRLYLSGNGLSFVWFYVPAVDIKLPEIEAGLRRKHGRWVSENGLEPELALDEDPRLHRVRTRDGRLEFEFGMRQADRSYFRGWRYHPLELDHVYTVVLKDDPFTVEVRAPFPAMRQALMRSLAAEIQYIDFAASVQCTLDEETARDRLEAELPSELFGKWDVGTGRGLESSRTYSDSDTPLRQQSDFLEQTRHDHRMVTHLEFRFFVTHPVDGYVERAEYGVNLRNGDMRVGARTSEIALEHLRKNVVRIVAGA